MTNFIQNLDLHKYPSTQHIQGPQLQRGDAGDRLSGKRGDPRLAWSALAGRRIVAEEKLDGANADVGFSKRRGAAAAKPRPLPGRRPRSTACFTIACTTRSSRSCRTSWRPADIDAPVLTHTHPVLAWGVPFALREQICRIITVHQLPFSALAGSKRGQSAEFLVHKLSHELACGCCPRAQADMEGRDFEKKADCLVGIALFRELAREEGCYGQPKAFADAHMRLCYFRGAGIAPGFAHHQNPGSRVVMMSRLPASGKEPLGRRNPGGLPVVSIDDARAALGLRHRQNEGADAHRAIELARELLRARQAFYRIPPT